MYKIILHRFVMYVKNINITKCYILGMDIAKTVGTNLKEARKAKGLTQKQAAAFLLMTQQQYSRFENGIFELNYSQIVKLCKLYDITPNDIFPFDEN